MLNVLLAEQPDNIASLLRFFCPKPGRLIDVSYGKGNLVSSLPPGWQLVGSDIAGHPADIQASWGALPFRAEAADCVLYDPPYLVDRASTKLHGRPDDSWKDQHSNAGGVVDHAVPISEAFRVLRSGGIFIAKVQNTRYRKYFVQHDISIRTVAEETGMIMRDVLVYLRLAVGIFKNNRTPQQAYGFYIVGEKP